MTAGVPRVASADAFCAAPEPPEHSVFADRQDTVLAAGWVESAVASDQRTDADLIRPDHGDNQQRRNGCQRAASEAVRRGRGRVQVDFRLVHALSPVLRQDQDAWYLFPAAQIVALRGLPRDSDLSGVVAVGQRAFVSVS